MTVSSKTKTTKSKSNGHPESNGKFVVGSGPYPLIPLSQISLVERPTEGEEHTQLFFNPRFVESFDSASMQELRQSICDVGLMQPLIVRVVMDGEDVNRVDLIAGERRFRSLQHLVENDEQVYDKDSGKYVAASKLYEFVACSVHYDVDDEQALRLACDENGKSKSLTTSEEIALVERLVSMGYTNEKIIELTGQQPSWVSHTVNFRKKLPERAFEMLTEGHLSRNVAVRIIGFEAKDREALLEATIEAEREATDAKLEDVQDEIAVADDTAQLAEWERNKALQAGNNAAAKKAERAKQAAEKKKGKAQARKEKIESEAGDITQGNLEEGARRAKISPKTPKQLSKQDIVTCIVEQIDTWLEDGYVDPMYGEDVSSDVLSTVRAVAVAIAEGDRDPVSIIRKVMVATEQWEDQDAFAAAESDFKNEDFDDDDFDDDFESDMDED